MSTTDHEKQQIRNRLRLLDEDSLSRSHNSVNLSFAQMLAYIDKLHNANLPEEIKCLLDTYRLMAEKFYIQFELSLLDKIAEQRDIRQKSNQVMEKLRNFSELEAGELETATDLLTSACDNANTTYNDLVRRFPSLLQNALDKLKNEWQRLDTIVVSNQALIRDEQLLRALEAVVKAAAYSVGIEKDRIVIVPGNGFALYFFTYLSNFAVLTVPIHSVRAPWEWSIFWHELAGYKVRQLESKSTINKLKANLRILHDFYTREENRFEWRQLLELMTHNGSDQKEELASRRNRFAYRYLNDLISRPRLVLNDLGSFEYQFELVLKNLKMKNKFQTYDEIKSQGWCVDWFEELFEDAFSVMTIGSSFLDFFKDILKRHSDNDGRHPPLDVRLKVAEALLTCMSADSEPGKPTTVEESAAQQILKFISLLTLASQPLPKEDEIDINLGMARIMNSVVRYELPESVGVQIGSSIQQWSNNFLSAKDRFNDAKEEAEKFINKFSVEDLEFISVFDRDTKSELTPSFESLLVGRDYEALLALSFYERDFFNGTDIKTVERLVKVTGVLAGWKIIFPEVKSTTIVDSLINEHSSGDVRFTLSSTQYKTTATNWNKVFGDPKDKNYTIK